MVLSGDPPHLLTVDLEQLCNLLRFHSIVCGVVSLEACEVDLVRDLLKECVGELPLRLSRAGLGKKMIVYGLGPAYSRSVKKAASSRLEPMMTGTLLL
eukprot:SAG11_NODE_646_length_7961_cov_2.885907_10_plen_98_part_00